MVIILESRFHVMRYVLLASLALSDFLLLILVNSFRIKSIAQEHWLYGQTMCYLNPFFVRYFYINTVLHLVAVSYNRYLAIVKSPLTYDGTITKTRVALIALIWIIPVIPISIGLFQGWGKYAYNPELIICEQGRAIDLQNGSHDQWKHDLYSYRHYYNAIPGDFGPKCVCFQDSESADKRYGSPGWLPCWCWNHSTARDGIETTKRSQGRCRCHYYHCRVFGVLSSLLGYRHLSPVRPRNRCSSRSRPCHCVYFLPQHNMQPDYLFHP